MQVILKTDVPHLGNAGEVVSVKPGYGANYLLPQGLALPATGANKHRIEHQRRIIEARLVRERANAETTASGLAGMNVSITRLVADSDKIFGSVTARDIADALEKEGYTVDSRKIRLEAPLKALGVYEVGVKLHRDVEAQVKVWVVAD